MFEFISTHAAANLIDIQRTEQEGHWRLWNTLSSHFAATKWTYGFSLPRSIDFTPSNDIFDGLNASDDCRRKLNIATAIATLLRPPDHACGFLEEHFIDTFVPPGTSLSEWQAELFYTIKVQVYIAELVENKSVSFEKVDHLFGRDVENALRAGNASRPLSTGENRLLEFCDWARKEHLGGDAFQITSNHDWNGVVCRALPHIRQQIRAILGHPEEPNDTIDPVLAGTSSVETMFNNQPPVAPGCLPQGDDGQPYSDDSFGVDEMVRVAALAAHAALIGQNMGDPYDDSPMSYNDYSPHIQQPDPFQLAYNQDSPYAQELSAQAMASASADAQHLASTREQYERARLAATAKAQAKNKASIPSPSQRRPWTQEEENALMTGLDRVQGPHWSQILAMYGAGGTISEVLKDRNQVQLKDKARNLKLFFLKSGHTVPHYLKHVTGELKTRAPATVAKNEARERLEESAGEDQAAVNAINVLAAGGRQGYGTASPQPDRSYGPLGGIQEATSNVGTATGFTAANRYSEPQEDQNVQEDFMANAIQQALAATRDTTGEPSPAKTDGGGVVV